MRIPFVFILASLALINIYSSCNKHKDLVIDYKHGYFPLKVGSVTVYEVDSIIYNPLFQGGRDTAHWEIREFTESVFTDNAGRDAYRIERHKRRDDSSPWISPEVWYAVADQFKAERVENNIRFIKLVFPPKEGLTWDGNSYIITNDTLKFYEDWNYVINSMDKPETINTLDFDSVITVVEIDDQNLLERRYAESKYAKGAGLVYKEQYNLQFIGTNIPNLPWEEKATNGFILKQKIKFFQ